MMSGPECGPLVGILCHQLPGAVRIAAAALHHPYEARLVWIAGNVGSDVVAVGWLLDPVVQAFSAQCSHFLGCPVIAMIRSLDGGVWVRVSARWRPPCRHFPAVFLHLWPPHAGR